MQLTLLKGYPDLIGRKQVIVGFGTGPASFNSTTGDPVTIPGYERYIDELIGGVLDTTATIIAYARPVGSGPRQTWALFYSTYSSGAALANLSAAASGLIFQLAAITSEY